MWEPSLRQLKINGIQIFILRLSFLQSIRLNKNLLMNLFESDDDEEIVMYISPRPNRDFSTLLLDWSDPFLKYYLGN